MSHADQSKELPHLIDAELTEKGRSDADRISEQLAEIIRDSSRIPAGGARTHKQSAAVRLQRAFSNGRCYVATSPLRRAEETILRGFRVFKDSFRELHQDVHLTEASKNIDSTVSPHRTSWSVDALRTIGYSELNILEDPRSMTVEARGNVPYYDGLTSVFKHIDMDEFKHQQFKVRLHMEAALDKGWTPQHDVIVLNGHSLTAFQALRAWARDLKTRTVSCGMSKMQNGSVVETTIHKDLEYTRIRILKLPQSSPYARLLPLEADVLDCVGLELWLQIHTKEKYT